MILVLFTSIYPFDGGGEQAFLDVEIQYLSQIFEKVILVPKKIVGQCLPLPDGVEVEESYAKLLSRFSLLTLMGGIASLKLVFRELCSRPSLIFYPEALRRMIRFAVVAMLTSYWVKTWLRYNDNEKPKVFYTYWFDSSAMGIGLVKQDRPELRLVSRVHGYDLYEEYYYHPPYWPFRREAMSFLDALFPDSEAGMHYLLQRYPNFSYRYETALLGVPKAGFVTASSSDDVFRIVSCSMLEPVKRLDLLLDGILYASRMRPNQRLEWTHIGNGKTRSELQENADKCLPTNARAFFPGYSNKDMLMSFYRTRPVDVFINVSASEGTPVSIMEAISCGIPVIATSVGGNPEIVSERNGILLKPNPTPQEIADAIFVLVDNPEMAVSKRSGSREIWSERYNADVNFQQFAERLKFIREDQ